MQAIACYCFSKLGSKKSGYRQSEKIMTKCSRFICVLAGVCATMCIATAVQAGVVESYPNFCSSSGLTLVGSTATAACQLQLTGSAGGEAGAAYSTTAIALGASATFSTTFQFQITKPGGINPADGIIFVLAASPTGLGTGGGDIGYGGVGNSVAIEFDTFNNGGSDGNSSNHIAINEDGHIIDGTSMSDQHLTNLYGVSTCNFSSGTLYTAPGCLSNGDIWSVTASYNGTSLSLSVTDPAEGGSTVIYNNLPLDISSFLGTNTAYVGFTAGTGGGYEAQNILNWQFANDTSLGTPEPSSLALIGSALAALALAAYRRKRRAVIQQAEL